MPEEGCGGVIRGVQCGVQTRPKTGIGAAWRLSQKPPSGPDRGRPDGTLPFLLLDKALAPGGHAASFTTNEGFTFDYGGHYVHRSNRGGSS